MGRSMATFTKLASGKYRAQVRKSGHYKSKTFTKKADAQKWSTEIERQIEQLTAHGHVSPKNLTIGYVVQQYQVETKPRGRTKNNVLNSLAAYFKTTKPDNLPVEVQRFIDYRLKQGITGATLSGDLSYLAGALDWAREAKKWAVNGDVARSARSGLKHRKVNTRSIRRERIPSNAELELIYAAYEAKPHLQTPMTTIIKFAIASGMRQGEITRITIEDVNFENRTVTIRDRKDPKQKIGNDQLIPLLPDAFAIVVDVVGKNTTGRIFPFNSKAYLLHLPEQPKIWIFST
jgi:integrase